MNGLDKSVTADFPLDEKGSSELLQGLESEVERLVEVERRKLSELTAVAELNVEVGLHG